MDEEVVRLTFHELSRHETLNGLRYVSAGNLTGTVTKTIVYLQGFLVQLQPKEPILLLNYSKLLLHIYFPVRK